MAKPIDLLIRHPVYEGGEALLRTLFPSIKDEAADTLVKMYPGNNPARAMKPRHWLHLYQQMAHSRVR
ncbi:hypothetical protein TPAR_04699 [Tolypocladium paradoxum]|uniref:Uncharacterized protein n=1 Tax=Tolypocladium paradoxum TaxID=94208 RepID=A0A2S4KY52_9HYPO|nr:hypothetical protein TPAR_04699 [Tolypocladium paradoxum]